MFREMFNAAISNIQAGNVSTGQYVALTLFLVIFFAVFAKTYHWLEKGGLYYLRYPGAKLLDDAKRQGKLTTSNADEIYRRVGAAKHPRTEVETLRAELDIKS